MFVFIHFHSDWDKREFHVLLTNNVDTIAISWDKREIRVLLINNIGTIARVVA